MADNSHIEWTDATWPVVQGCDYESPGCTNCYAVPLIWRHQHHPDPKISAPIAGLVEKTAKGNLIWTGKLALREDRLDWPLKWRAPRRIFVPSHGDLFHQGVPDAFIDKVFAVMALAPQHTFQVLTKRADRMRDYFKVDGSNDDPEAVHQRILTAAYDLLGNVDRGEAERLRDLCEASDSPLPLPNVWLGVSVEDQKHADERIPLLLDTPAAKRFISAEPLLGPIDLTRIAVPDDRVEWAGCRRDVIGGEFTGVPFVSATKEQTGTITIGPVTPLDWVIVGGESGPNARPMHPDWARDLLDQCASAGVAYFFKQHGEWIGVTDLRKLPGGSGPGFGAFDHCAYDMEHEAVRVGKKAAGRLLDGVEHNGFPA